ncbi:MAG: DUF1311 domain-containing protein [Synergistaceae bacterium]|nr:DUF1311 domain-containing protein [Synergistaceae bacterium]
MKRLISVFILMFLIALPAFALSDAEYLKMRKSSSDFARADKRLNQVWSSLKKSLPKTVFSVLERSQAEWVKTGRDDEASAYMDDGYSRMEAYTMATNARADDLPKIADTIRKDLKNKNNAPQSKKNSEPQRVRKPEPEPEEPEPEPEEPGAPLSSSEIAGEYQSSTGFVSIRIIDLNTDEAEVTFSRFKDGTHWTARGWIDENVIELSDSEYSSCQATLTFSRKTVKVEVSETDDWNEAIAPDFVVAGTYRKH